MGYRLGNSGSRRDWLLFVPVLALAAVLRFRGLGSQSYWYDESATVDLVNRGFFSMLGEIPDIESTPPVYYAVAWVWAQVFGSDEAGLRSLSAVAGIGAVAFTWAAGRRLLGAWTSLVAAALVAASPLLVWYSQEARAYALLTLLAAASMWAVARVLRSWRPLDLGLWSACCALMLGTHYFAVFLVVAEAALLLWLSPVRRRVLFASVPFAAVGLALLPLAQHQEGGGRTAWIAASPLSDRVADVVRELATNSTVLISSNSPAPDSAWGLVALVALLVAAGGVLWRRTAPREAGLVAIVGVGALLLPLVLSFTPLDYFKDRNLIGAWIPLLLLAGVCFVYSPRALGLPAAMLFIIAGLVVNDRVVREPALQRHDWRQVARELGPPTRARVVRVEPPYAKTAIEVYGHDLIPVPAGVPVHDVYVVGQLQGRPAPPPLSGFRIVEDRPVQQLRLIRYVAVGEPVAFTPEQLRAAGSSVVYEASDAATRWVGDYKRLGEALRRLAVEGEYDGITADSLDELAGRLRSPPEDLPTATAVLDELELALTAADVLLRAPTPDAASRARRALQQALAQANVVQPSGGS